MPQVNEFSWFIFTLKFLFFLFNFLILMNFIFYSSIFNPKSMKKFFFNILP